MRLLLICILLFFAFGFRVAAQSYFQQEVNYKINVKLDDKKHSLSAYETIEYINNSPDTLKFLYFHLWPNAYSNDYTAFAKQRIENKEDDFYFSNPEKRGWIDSLDFKTNGEKILWNLDSENIDICKLILKKPLAPKSKVNISTPFFVKIPDSFSRLGRFFQSYQVTQWYPKPAVYDKNGWNRMPYVDMGEFYSEFGSYDVSITVPANYVVAATGNLINTEEKQWIGSMADETKKIQVFDSHDFTFPASDNKTKILRFTEKNIHDFAWFADKRYYVLQGEVTLPHSKRKVTTWVYFTNYKAELWKNALQYVNDAVYYYSLWIGDYPYDNCTAVDGSLGAGGGMEYPTITVIGAMGDSLSLEEVIMHEVGHNWFYGILGSNERKHPWIDEGINSFYELRYMTTKYPKLKLESKIPNSEAVSKFFGIHNLPYKYMDYLAYLYTARLHSDQPCELPSEEFTPLNYGAIVYMKTAYLFNYLKSYIGDNEFDRIIQLFFDKWKFRHPQPEDIRQIFKENCNKNLDWFFEDLIKTNKKIDYKIKGLKKGLDPLSWTGDCWDVTVKNCGDVAAPFPVSAVQNDSIISTKWFDGFTGTKTIKVHFIDFDKLIIDGELDIPDVNRKNNTIRKNGIFRKVEPLQLKFLASLENPDKTQLFYTPVCGWNNYDKTMIGLLLYNNIAPAEQFDFQLMPMYSYVLNDFAGSGKISYTLYPDNKFIHNVNLNISAMQYAFDHDPGYNFQRYKAEADITLQKKNARSSIESHILFSSIAATDFIDKAYNKKDDIDFFENLGFYFANTRIINPYHFSLHSQTGKDFTKAWMEADYKFTYNKVKKGLFIRFFAGKFLYNNTTNPFYNFRLTGNLGTEDYTYDQVFLGRTNDIRIDTMNVWARQFTKTDGGFTIFSPLGQTNDWLVSLNLSTSIPSEAPFRLYTNIATYSDINSFYKSNGIVWEMGIELSIIPDIFAVYFPVTMSDDLKETNEFYAHNYWQKIRFTLNLNKLNPFDYRKIKAEMFY
ncbi:MAG: M1 family metallopeptidase [Bacteroidia bacterium]|nr:M1 family metallopeptidase [Bacteroidia bacterium]